MMKSYVHVLILGIGISAIVCSTAQAVDWPNYRWENYNGISSETGWTATWPEEGPKVLWKFSLGTGFASMAVSNGKVYAMGNIDDKDFLRDCQFGNTVVLCPRQYFLSVCFFAI